MTLGNLIVMLICSVIALVASLLIFKGRNTDKENLMSVERCNFKDCDLCIDKEQCLFKKEDLV